MPDEPVKRKRGRPRKNPVVEENSNSSPTSNKDSQQSSKSNPNYEFNSFRTSGLIFDSIYKCGIYSYRETCKF